MGQLAISNIINVSVSQISSGANAYNTSNLALFTDEAPNLGTFGNLGYAIYVSPTQVGIDFGTASSTYAMALAVFSQQPNILNGNGQLIIILLKNSKQNLAFSGIAASGTFEITSTNGSTAAINWDDTASEIQTKLQAVTGQSEWIVTGSIASQSLNIQCASTYGAVTLFTISANSLMTSAPAAITITVTSTQAGETIQAAITRTQGLVNYFGVMVNETLSVIGQTDLLAAAAVIQSLLLIGFFVSNQEADIQSGGMIDLLATGSLDHTRGLYYGDSTALNDLIFLASYASLGLSTNFTGSNTTQTLNLKQLVGVQPDLTLTQTIYNLAVAAGADTYPSWQGTPGISSTGANTFYDQVYGTLWFAGAVQIAEFNYLATTNTKIPQTEAGMDGLKTSARGVCQQAVTNGFVAPGTWNSATIFGDPSKFILNISQFGYYIFSTPIAQQSQSDRDDRLSPLAQIAIKLAGAIQKGNTIVYINP